MNIECLNRYIEDAIAVESIPSPTLLERMPALVRRERAAAAAVIAHLVEIERRRLYLDEACSSLFTYCRERLGYSEDEATRRVRVARLAAVSAGAGRAPVGGDSSDGAVPALSVRHAGERRGAARPGARQVALGAAGAHRP